jgi:hypothetical protein
VSGPLTRVRIPLNVGALDLLPTLKERYCR